MRDPVVRQNYFIYKLGMRWAESNSATRMSRTKAKFRQAKPSFSINITDNYTIKVDKNYSLLFDIWYLNQLNLPRTLTWRITFDNASFVPSVKSSSRFLQMGTFLKRFWAGRKSCLSSWGSFLPWCSIKFWSKRVACLPLGIAGRTYLSKGIKSV